MKKLSFIIIALVLVAACKKSSTSVNSMTITDNGKTYTTNSDVLVVTIQKTTANSGLTWQTKGSSDFPFTMTMGAVGPLNSIGTFETLGAIDTVSVNYMHIGGGTDTNYNTRENGCKFTETFSGGEDYTVDSLIANITDAENSDVKGTFTIYLHNTSGYKVVNGSLNCAKAVIQ